MHFLALQHLDIEPPALIGEVLEAGGHNLTTLHLDQGDLLPASATLYDGIIIMGGPQSANDHTDYIKNEVSWIKSAIMARVPILGICLGAQIMAKAAGAEIHPSPVRELGWFPVYPTPASQHDPLFCDMSEGIGLFQWHGESFTVNPGMTLVATHPDVPAQAFRIGQAQYGLQFHIEVNESMIENWIAHSESERNQLGIEGINLLHKETPLYIESMQKFCRQLVINWLSEIAA